MMDFAYLSLVGVYSAMAVYTLSFVAFTWDLARRSAAKPVAVMAGGGGREAEAPAAPSAWGPFQRIGLTLLVLGWILHLLATIGRGIAGNRVPWANMFEFVLLALGVVTVNFYVDVTPLPPALQSAWLVIHVFVASTATAFFALGAALSVLQLVRARYEAQQMAKARIMNTLPGSSVMESLAYRLNVVGFVLWSFTLMAGAIWAERAWGRYWGWDVKEVWTFIIWVLFAGYIHARATRGWRGSRAAWLAIIGFGAVIFNYTVVNIAFTGLHSYSGL
jgi:ABC-type transport system involved in cytochrome c biogenesis permease subunit